jgi:hemolysin activation/secretion protein
MLFNNKFEFYQAATLGGDNDLRGYRRERFTGKDSFLQSTDLRFTIGKLRTGFLPIKYGVYAGYDYGRVWAEGEDSNKWHQSGGGGIWFNGVDALTAKISYFKGTDTGRVVFGLALGF